MHFIPNPANTEFIYLTGLEECVNRILNLDATTPPMPKPFTCSQCHTDFTPTWKWDKAAKGKFLSQYLNMETHKPGTFPKSPIPYLIRELNSILVLFCVRWAFSENRYKI